MTALLELEHLDVAYRTSTGPSRVVHDVSFDVARGEVLALVGESGSGKTTTASAVLGLLPAGGAVEGGAIRLSGTDISGWSDRRLQAVRGVRIGYIPQDPVSSLNPVRPIGVQLGEAFRIHRRGDRRDIRRRVLELLDRVGIDDPALRARQYPHELSGGMRQRVLIASAVALEPEVVIADEPTSALDVTVQRRILDLIDELRRE
ncbi:MAG: ABC transporter ATP-binding protein, partial [Agromyces sp.]|nr:ABC transporter ATP-binding protein [Agromyces sp.]